PESYLDPGVAAPRWAATSAGLGGLVLGALAAGLRPIRLWRLPWLLGAASLIVTGSGYSLFAAFASPRGLSLVAIVVPALGAGAIGASLALVARALARTPLALGALERLPHPLRLGALALAVGGLAAAATAVDLPR